MSSVRVATANLLHGRSLTDGLVDTARMVAAISDLDVDVVALQEVDRNQARSGTVDQTTAIATAWGEGVSFRFAPAIIGEPGGSWRAATPSDDLSGHDLPAPDGSAAYGIGLVTRLPVERWEILRLPAAPVRSPIMLPGSRRLILLPDEPRVCVVAVVPEGTAPFRIVASTHLSFVPGWNVRQLRQVLRALLRFPGPHLLLGDLNLPAWSVRASVRARRGTQWVSLAKVPTFPGPEPRVQFDHILAHGPVIAASRGQANAMAISDHRALVVDVAANR
jgi:endonuclease/exonuclease/phosphatase family metal-dependent hydrolase